MHELEDYIKISIAFKSKKKNRQKEHNSVLHDHCWKRPHYQVWYKASLQNPFDFVSTLRSYSSRNIIRSINSRFLAFPLCRYKWASQNNMKPSFNISVVTSLLKGPSWSTFSRDFIRFYSSLSLDINCKHTI